MAMAMRMHKVGGPEVLSWEDVEVPAPKQGEAFIRHPAVGLNYIDTYHRSGLNPLPMPPLIG
ncbi:MAG: quinone oxidoreductase, partial [Alphaproteobacteria bacterium]